MSSGKMDEARAIRADDRRGGAEKLASPGATASTADARRPAPAGWLSGAATRRRLQPHYFVPRRPNRRACHRPRLRRAARPRVWPQARRPSSETTRAAQLEESGKRRKLHRAVALES